MKYLSLDLEATGLDECDRIIEFATVPFCTTEKKVEDALAFHTFVKCPSFNSLRASLSPWVVENNRELINKAHTQGVNTDQFKKLWTTYLESTEIKNYFNLQGKEKIVLFGKSMSAIDLPFLTRDLGWDYMRTHFHYQTVDLSSVARAMVDMGMLPPPCVSGKELMIHFKRGKVAHTALDDAINAAMIYIEIAAKRFP